VIEGETKEETTFCYYIVVYINAKNRMGGYVGEKTYFFYFKNHWIFKHIGGY